MNAISLAELEEVVRNYVNFLKDSPKARLASREAFYLKYGRGNILDKYGFGDSEIAFIRWEERGVLKPPHVTPPGSEWWGEVNLWFIYLSELGKKAYEIEFPYEQLPKPAQFWVEFIKEPNPQNWYRAHNSSIIDGYLKFPHLAKKENEQELVFINMVLYRLMFAQSLVEGDFIFPRLFKLLANPKGMSVDLITHVDEFYPSSYPLTAEEIAAVMGTAHNLEEFGVQFLDAVLIEPELTHLYHQTSLWNQQPELNSLILNHRPSYPHGIMLPEPHKGYFVRFLIWLRKLFFGNT